MQFVDIELTTHHYPHNSRSKWKKGNNGRQTTSNPLSRWFRLLCTGFNGNVTESPTVDIPISVIPKPIFYSWGIFQSTRFAIAVISTSEISAPFCPDIRVCRHYRSYARLFDHLWFDFHIEKVKSEVEIDNIFGLLPVSKLPTSSFLNIIFQYCRSSSHDLLSYSFTI